MDENQIYKEAKKRVNKKKGFYGHLGVYLVVNTIMFFVVFINSGTFGWLIPAAFWGIGLAINYLSVFGFPGKGVGGVDWEAKEIRKEVEKMGGSIHDLPREELNLREIQKEKRGWDESDLV